MIMSNGKPRMATKKFLLILVPILVVLFASVLVITLVMNYYAGVMDTYLGRGNRVIVDSNGSEEWDKDYYDQKYATDTESQAASAVIAEQICDEGTVLLKNNGVLPLARTTTVTPFGYRYRSPFYGGTGSGNVRTDDPIVVTPQKALADEFTVNTTVENVIAAQIKVNKYFYDLDKGDDVLHFFMKTDSFNGSDHSLYEFASGTYAGTESSCAGSTAIVFIGRSGGENNDLWTVPYNSVAPVDVSKAGEDDAKPTGGADTDAVQHALMLTPEEKDMIKFAKTNCENVVAVINSSNALQLGDIASDGEYSADAIVWIGGPGAKGYASLANVLSGDVTPSGRTPDIFVRDLTKDPTYLNIGDVDGFTYTNTDGLAPMKSKHYAASRKASGPMNYIEYEEGMYMGYRYYETAAAEIDGYAYGELNADGSVKTAGEVIYPFGYGLSYAEFSQEITSFTGNKDKVSVTVKVTNTKGSKGKEVVQVYFEPPYTTADAANKIEKPAVTLAGFGKTKELATGESDYITVEFATSDMASYSVSHQNDDGTNTTGCYMLSAGEYKISLRKNSHDVIDARTFDISDTIWFDNDNPRSSETSAQAVLDDNGNPTSVAAKGEFDVSENTFVTATNRFEDSTRYMNEVAQNLTRSDFDVSKLVAGEKYKAAPQWVADALSPFDYATDALLGNVSGSKIYKSEAPKGGEEHDLVVSAMRGLSYYDPTWDELLNQLDYSSTQLMTLIFYDQYCTHELDEIGLGTTISRDGPQGITLKTDSFDAETHKVCAFSSAPIVAATFNADLAYAYGEALGQEMLTLGYTGWYAPGLNIHRTAFSGRNFEYYSEDPLLSGKIAARVVSGAGDQGVTSYIKHFALNDNDTNRANICVWANEQVMREIYLRSFEICVKEARMTVKYIADESGKQITKIMRASTALMTAYNYIGTTFSGGSYALIEETLRGEWGFRGAIISDMTGTNEFASPTSWRRDEMIRAGNDMVLWVKEIAAQDTSSATAQWRMRDAVHNIAYMIANSNAMQGVAPGSVVYYTMSPWAICLLVANIVIDAFVLVMIVLIVLRALDAKKRPENYKK